MRALLLDRPGGPGSLRMAQISSPWQVATPLRPERPVDVLIKVEAIGLNPVDYKTAAAGLPNWTYPHVLGLDIAGVVVAVHATSSARAENDWMIPKPGTRVVMHQDMRAQGGFAEYISVPPDTLAVVPRTIDPIAAASLPTPGLTALDAVERRLRQIVGQTVLIHGGSGGVGGMAIQLAKLYGARVIATARPENDALVRSLGAVHVLDYRDRSWEDHLLALVPGGVDAIIDTVSSASATSGMRLLRHAGHMVCVAGRPDLSAVPAFGLAPTISEVAIGAAYATGDLRDRRWLSYGLERLMRLVNEGHIHPVDIQTVAMEEIPGALERLANREVIGKIVANLRWS